MDAAVIKYLILIILLFAGSLAVEAYGHSTAEQSLSSPAVQSYGNSTAKQNLSSPHPNLLINEIMASNATTVEDEDGDAEDWVEIYNAGNESLNLNEYSLSDDYDEPYQWMFPEITLDPGDYLLIWASGKDRRDPESELHTNFRIAASGEEVILTHYDGTRVDALPPTEIPTDISIGRKPGGSDKWYFFKEPTPGAANATAGYSGVLEPPAFSVAPGFYSEEIELTIEHPDPDATIYYTLNGSEPTTESSAYSIPIKIRDRSDDSNDVSSIPTAGSIYWSEPEEPVKKSTVVRTRAIKSGFISSSVTAGTFFIDQKGAQRYSLPVVSISTDRDHFFNDETGIYVYGNSQNGNFQERGPDWERPVHIEMFNEKGNLFLDQPAGVRIHGGATRFFGQKSFRFYARNEYGDNRFYHPIFPDQPFTEYNRLLLRNSGNDWQSTMFRDALAQSLICDINVDTQAYRPAIVFLNGEYWGIHNLRERYDRHYLARVYNVDPGNIDLLTNRNEVKEGNNNHYNKLIEFIEQNDLGEEVHFARVKEMMDLDNFLDYYSAQIYYGNRDWPHNNIDFWRMRVPYDSTASIGHDGRWRWLLFDVDYALGLHASYEFDTINRLLSNEGWPTTILRNLLDNEQFEVRFINRIADHLNSVFTPDRVLHYIDSLASVVQPEINEHIARWGRPDSMDEWESDIESMKTFAANRPEAMRQHLLAQFDIQKQILVSVDISDNTAGRIRVNSIQIRPETPGIDTNPWPWNGTYFQEVPITLAAEANSGYAFSHWDFLDQGLQSTDLTITLRDLSKDSTTVKAVFKSKDDTAGEGDEEMVEKFKLYQNNPNPFNPETNIRYRLPVRSDVHLEVFDILGKRVATLVDETRQAGMHQVSWDASNVASGLYIYRIRAGEFVQSRSMLLIK